MQKYWNTVQDERGNPRYGASVSVQQNGVNSSIYTDSAGLIPAANPLTTDSTRGYFEFYAAAGTYDLSVFGVGFSPYTITAGANLGLPSGDVTFTQSGTGAVSRTVQAKEREAISLFDFFTTTQIADVQAGTLSVDVGSTVNAAIATMEARGGGVIKATQGFYKSTEVLLMKRGVWLAGDGKHKPGASFDGVTIFYGAHTGAAVMSLKGAHECQLSDFSLYSPSATHTKVGLLLGRDSASSAGKHYIKRVQVDGYYTYACIYSIASESNVWMNVDYLLRGGGGSYGFYTDQGDSLSVDSLTGSSNLSNTIKGMEGINMVNDAAAAGIYINGGLSTGSWNIEAYLIQYKGSYITINNGTADGLDTLGPIRCEISGEIYDQAGGGAPQQGYNLTGTTGLRGLTIKGGRFQFVNSTGNERSIKQGANVTLKQPFITLQTMDNATAEFQFSKISDGFVQAGVQSFTGPALTNSWVDTFATGNGYSTVGYYRDPTGFVHLQGHPNGGTLGAAIFTLPAGYRPAASKIFAVSSNDAFGAVEVLSSGVVQTRAGNNTYVSLEGITFKAA